jgi:hypothetical protein
MLSLEQPLWCCILLNLLGCLPPPPQHVEVLQLLADWEAVKRSFNGANSMLLRLPYSLVRGLPSHVSSALDSRRRGYPDRIVMHAAEMKAIFDPVVEEMLKVGLGALAPAAWMDEQIPAISG